MYEISGQTFIRRRRLITLKQARQNPSSKTERHRFRLQPQRAQSQISARNPLVILSPSLYNFDRTTCQLCKIYRQLWTTQHLQSTAHYWRNCLITSRASFCHGDSWHTEGYSSVHTILWRFLALPDRHTCVDTSCHNVYSWIICSLSGLVSLISKQLCSLYNYRIIDLNYLNLRNTPWIFLCMPWIPMAAFFFRHFTVFTFFAMDSVHQQDCYIVW